MPHSIALAATGLDPENGLGVVKAWVESGGDVNGLFDPDASDHGGRDGCHSELNGLAEGGEPLLSLVVGILPIYDEGDCRDRLELIRYLLSRGANPNNATAYGTIPLHLLAERPEGRFRFTATNLLCDAGANLEATEYDAETGHTPLATALVAYHHDNMDYLMLLLRRGASLDFPRCSYVRPGVARNTAEATLRSQLLWFASPDSIAVRPEYKARLAQSVEEKLRLVTAVRAAGSWKGYVRTPHKSLVVFRSLLARGRARRRPLWDHPTPHALVRLFDPSLPNGVFWHVLSYWRETG